MKSIGVLVAVALVAAGFNWRTELIGAATPYLNSALDLVGFASARTAAGGTPVDPARPSGRTKTGSAAAADATPTPGAADAGGKAGNKRRAGGGPVAVTTAEASAEDMPVTRRTIGVVASPANLTVTSQVTGLVTDVVAQDGASVKSGDVIVRLDDRIAAATAAKDKAALARDQASLEHAQAVLERQRRLVTTQAASQQTLDDAAVVVETAEATVALDQAVLSADEVTLSQTVITAPFDGRLGAIAVVKGSLVQPSTSIVRLTRLDPLQATFALPERDVATVQEALATGRPIGVSVTPLGTERSFSGTLDFVDANVDSTSGTFTARATLAGAVGQLLPGQSLAVAVTLGTEAVVAVPSVAVQTAQNGTVVYVVGGDGKIAVKPVTVALADGDRSGLSAGLAAGERVVVEGLLRLAPGMAVTDTSAPPREGAPVSVSEAGKTGSRP